MIIEWCTVHEANMYPDSGLCYAAVVEWEMIGEGETVLPCTRYTATLEVIE